MSESDMYLRYLLTHARVKRMYQPTVSQFKWLYTFLYFYNVTAALDTLYANNFFSSGILVAQVSHKTDGRACVCEHHARIDKCVIYSQQTMPFFPPIECSIFI